MVDFARDEEKSYKVLVGHGEKCRRSPEAAFGHAGTKKSSPRVLPGLSSARRMMQQLRKNWTQLKQDC